MSNDAKLIRGQIRQVAKELLPTVLAEEAALTLRKEIMELVNARMDLLTKKVEESLAEMDNRAKLTHSYMIRQSSQR